MALVVERARSLRRETTVAARVVLPMEILEFEDYKQEGFGSYCVGWLRETIMLPTRARYSGHGDEEPFCGRGVLIFGWWNQLW